jgi:hypothetical protein
MRASRFECSSDRARSMSPLKRVQRTAKGAIRAGAIRSMQAFTGEVGRATLAGFIYAASWREQVAAQPALLLTGEAAKKSMWPCTYKLHCSLCALNAGNYRIALPKTLRFSSCATTGLWRALFAADCATACDTLGRA